MGESRTYVVTGATGGLGKVVIETLLASGASLVAMGRSAGKLKALKEEAGAGERLRTVVVDVGDPESVDGAFESLAALNISGVAHTVGGYTGGRSIDETPIGDLDKMVALNVRSTFLVLRAGSRALKAVGLPAGIVCVGSATGRSGASGHAPYAATKAAVHSLVRSAAVDLAGDLIRVNAVLPGMIATPANLAAMPEADHSTWVTPEEIAATIAFLLSESATGITGACIEITGKGYTPD